MFRPRARGRTSLGEEGLATVELLTSEVVTNALLHGRDAPRLVVACRGDTRAGVGRGCRPSLARPARPWPRPSCGAAGSRWLTPWPTAWGIERLGQVGKRVWFEVREGQEWPAGFVLHWNR